MFNDPAIEKINEVLRPCPFCGGKAIINQNRKHGLLYNPSWASCINVDCLVALTAVEDKDYIRAAQIAANRWNSRAY